MDANEVEEYRLQLIEKSSNWILFKNVVDPGTYNVLPCILNDDTWMYRNANVMHVRKCSKFYLYTDYYSSVVSKTHRSMIRDYLKIIPEGDRVWLSEILLIAKNYSEIKRRAIHLATQLSLNNCSEFNSLSVEELSTFIELFEKNADHN